MTLNELSQLRDSEFGRPSPRHGLNLLYWFAQDFVTFSDGLMIPKENPSTNAYGFHRFYNFDDDDDDDNDHDHVNALLPKQKLPYYDVGNLNAPGAEKLPSYVRKNYNHRVPKSNMDRIMVRLNGNFLERVYITQHVNKKCFGHTYRISQGLLMNIKNMSLEEFLKKMQPPQIQYQNQSYLQAGYSQSAYVQTEPSNDSWCVIL
ncbi:uncharacterized protein LOC103044655 [Astyanax mexicanus]|uniref:uncharacterized protein LOC103044655 n=1 Tax=Astyanax mexicanus TaxID=7994 RepID=UPI0020CAFAB2|nr:uncharacterized protein LOC103044655 [Astyanax mexicanus]